MATESGWTPEQIHQWAQTHLARTEDDRPNHTSVRLASWWDSRVLPDLGGPHNSTSPSSWIEPSLIKTAIEGGDTVVSSAWEGNLVVPARQLIDTITTVLGCRLVRLNDSGNGNGAFLFSTEHAMLAFYTHAQGKTGEISMVTSDSELVIKANQIFSKVLVPDDPKKGVVYVLAQGMSGYSLKRLGLAGTVLERGNYTDEVLASYDHVVEDLQTESPCGRLAIFAGAPGTGKTFIVRALLQDVPHAAFVLIPPHLVSELSGPAILPALTNVKGEFNGPMVLVIEDADRVLVKREDGEMNGISSMLNLGDGILGSVLDVRILATTNATTLEMDPATRRPGRLCRFVDVGPLNAAKANEVFERLTGKEGSYDDETTVAQVYLDARNNGWVPPKAIPEGPKERTELL